MTLNQFSYLRVMMDVLKPSIFDSCYLAFQRQVNNIVLTIVQLFFDRVTTTFVSNNASDVYELIKEELVAFRSKTVNDCYVQLGVQSEFRCVFEHSTQRHNIEPELISVLDVLATQDPSKLDTINLCKSNLMEASSVGFWNAKFECAGGVSQCMNRLRLYKLELPELSEGELNDSLLSAQHIVIEMRSQLIANLKNQELKR